MKTETANIVYGACRFIDTYTYIGNRLTKSYVDLGPLDVLSIILLKVLQHILNWIQQSLAYFNTMIDTSGFIHHGFINL